MAAAHLANIVTLHVRSMHVDPSYYLTLRVPFEHHRLSQYVLFCW
jgi:hypothetical protein